MLLFLHTLTGVESTKDIPALAKATGLHIDHQGQHVGLHQFGEPVIGYRNRELVP
tara:strand:- start:791 stop:955 length:165 start_codon:yes stop_codon:yes gene_type:complete